MVTLAVKCLRVFFLISWNFHRKWSKPWKYLTKSGCFCFFKFQISRSLLTSCNFTVNVESSDEKVRQVRPKKSKPKFSEIFPCELFQNWQLMTHHRMTNFFQPNFCQNELLDFELVQTKLVPFELSTFTVWVTIVPQSS